jgi:hypothetical protein
MRKQIGMIECRECGQKFRPKRRWHIFCETKCRVKNWQKKNAYNDEIKKLNKRISELEKKLNQKEIY